MSVDVQKVDDAIRFLGQVRHLLGRYHLKQIQRQAQMHWLALKDVAKNLRSEPDPLHPPDPVVEVAPEPPKPKKKPAKDCKEFDDFLKEE